MTDVVPCRFALHRRCCNAPVGDVVRQGEGQLRLAVFVTSKLFKCGRIHKLRTHHVGFAVTAAASALHRVISKIVLMIGNIPFRVIMENRLIQLPD